MIEVIFRGREFRGTEDDADWGIRHKDGGTIGATLKRVDDKKSGFVRLRFDSIAKPAGTAIGYVERGERGTLKLTILPVAKEISAQYEPVEGFPLVEVDEKRLLGK